MPSIRNRAALAAALTALAVATSTLGAVSAASAAELTPGNEIAGGTYTITLNPTGRAGFDEDFGLSALNIGPTQLKISTGCPTGYRASSRTFVVTPSGGEKGVSPRRTNAEAPLFGLTGSPITLAAPSEPNFENLTEETLPTGINRLVVTCDATVSDADGPIGDSKYFVAYIQVDRATESWKQVSKPAASKTATTTTLAASGTTTMSTTLSATVSPTTATGSVTFSQGGTVVGTADVSNGVATLGLSGLTPATAYSFTAAYAGDGTHEASSTAAATAVTTVTPVATGSTNVGVTVPAAGSSVPTGLKITVASSAVTLIGGDRASGQVWTATGSLGAVTVTDDRRAANAGAWSLNGSATTFTGSAGEFAASNLGWAPKIVSGTGTAGASAADLSQEQKLASGAQPTTDANVVTVVDAGLTLKVPSTVPTGEYTARLTLTLI